MKNNEQWKMASSWYRGTLRQMAAVIVLGPAFWLAPPALALTPEFVVNQITDRSQRYPDVASAPSGRFVAVWYDQPSGAIFGRRFKPDATPLGDQFQLNTGDNSADPMVAVDSYGRAFVAWTAPTGSGSAVVARRYAASDKALEAQEFVVKSLVGQTIQLAGIAGAPDGRTAILYANGSGLAFQRYNASGKATGAEVAVTSSMGAGADIAVQNDGSSMVTWVDGSGLVRISRYSSQGALLSTTQVDLGAQPTITAAAKGAYVVSYQAPETFSGYSKAVYARLVSSQGAPVGSRITIDTAPPGPQDNTEQFTFKPHVDADANGRFFVVYTRRIGGYDDGANLAYGQRFEANGAAVTSPQLLASVNACCSADSRLAVSRNGDAVVIWQDGTGSSDGIDGLDGSERGITGRLFPAP